MEAGFSLIFQRYASSPDISWVSGIRRNLKPAATRNRPANTLMTPAKLMAWYSTGHISTIAQLAVVEIAKSTTDIGLFLLKPPRAFLPK
jgi:hypothetical protein